MLGEDQLKGSNSLVLPDGADAGSGMQAERLPQPASLLCIPLGPPTVPLIPKSRCCTQSSGIYPPLLGFKPAVWELAPGSQAHGVVPPDRSVCVARSCTVQAQKHSPQGSWKLSPDCPSPSSSSSRAPSPTNKAGPACSFIVAGNWEGENCVGILAHRTCSVCRSVSLQVQQMTARTAPHPPAPGLSGGSQGTCQPGGSAGAWAFSPRGYPVPFTHLPALCSRGGVGERLAARGTAARHDATHRSSIQLPQATELWHLFPGAEQ